MEIDKVTFNDLSVFQADEDQGSIFDTLNFTRTNGGKAQLMRMFTEPFSRLEQIIDTQNILKILIHQKEHWPEEISNGTVMVMEKFYATSIDPVSAHPSALGALGYKIFHNSDYSLIRFSITHFADFFRGLKKIVDHFNRNDAPAMLQLKLQRASHLLHLHRPLQELAERKPGVVFSPKETLRYAYFFKGRFKHECFELMDMYSQLDAWYSMAMATSRLNLAFPEITNGDTPYIEAIQLYHLMLPTPVAYDVELKKDQNFLFLTGANMAGKSTYIKAVGIAVFLAHLGMGVPAQKLQLSLFDGLLSNIQVVDNISKGESYFFNEVQRIRNTVLKISNGKKWLVLIDELFKGTNVQDAMKCSDAVVRGLIKISNAIFILSTHLYEIGNDLKQYPNIVFRYFETFANDDELEFSYVLKEGISNDRLGYLILKREGVVDLLERL
jgi:DNA mismatch repair protein MutS